MKQDYVWMLPQRELLAIIIFPLFFAITMGAAYAADVLINTPPGGNFVVKNNAGTTTLLKVEGGGPVTVPNLPSAPTYTTGVCFGSGGVLGQCASIAGPMGPPGPTGPTGAAGAAGADGANGTNGSNGAAGANGTNGTDGNTLLYGSGAPLAGTGVDGNFYIDTVANFIYGPKAAGAWPAGVSIVGPTGATGAAGTNGTNGINGSNGTNGVDGTNGAAGANGTNGTNGNTLLYGAGAPSGGTGVDGNFYIDTVANFIYGPKATGAWPAGVPIVGPAGATGATGPTGATGVMSSGMYVQLGAQPATVAAGQPLTFSTTVLASPAVTPSTAVFTPPFTASGTVFQLANIGRYEINYQIVFPTDGGIVLYLGATSAGMVSLPYTMIGKTPNGAVSGSVIIETTTTGAFLSVNAAPGNTVAVDPPPNSSTTNQNATTVSIKQIQ